MYEWLVNKGFSETKNNRVTLECVFSMLLKKKQQLLSRLDSFEQSIKRCLAKLQDKLA